MSLACQIAFFCLRACHIRAFVTLFVDGFLCPETAKFRRRGSYEKRSPALAGQWAQRDLEPLTLSPLDGDEGGKRSPAQAAAVGAKGTRTLDLKSPRWGRRWKKRKPRAGGAVGAKGLRTPDLKSHSMGAKGGKRRPAQAGQWAQRKIPHPRPLAFGALRSPIGRGEKHCGRKGTRTPDLKSHSMGTKVEKRSPALAGQWAQRDSNP